ncbi:MAG: hypothetical protein ACKPHU_05640 [Planctomycetaceae bacterium]
MVSETRKQTPAIPSPWHSRELMNETVRQRVFGFGALAAAVVAWGSVLGV